MNQQSFKYPSRSDLLALLKARDGRGVEPRAAVAPERSRRAGTQVTANCINFPVFGPR